MRFHLLICGNDSTYSPSKFTTLFITNQLVLHYQFTFVSVKVNPLKLELNAWGWKMTPTVDRRRSNGEYLPVSCLVWEKDQMNTINEYWVLLMTSAKYKRSMIKILVWWLYLERKSNWVIKFYLFIIQELMSYAL